MIAGYVVASAVSVLVGGALSRASGDRHHQVARVIRVSLLGAAVILALTHAVADRRLSNQTDGGESGADCGSNLMPFVVRSSLEISEDEFRTDRSRNGKEKLK